jgi:hypothetical protein
MGGHERQPDFERDHSGSGNLGSVSGPKHLPAHRRDVAPNLRRRRRLLTRVDASPGQTDRLDPHELRTQADRPGRWTLVSPQLHEDVWVVN